MVSPRKLTIVIILFLALFYAYIYLSNYSRVNLSDPVVQNALKECGIDKTDGKSGDCYLQAALGNYKPEVCLLAGASIQGLCIQRYYEGRNSAAACGEIKKLNAVILAGCEEFYRQECSTDADCVETTCCHATACVSRQDFPALVCDELCTQDCNGPMDCGHAYCGCERGKCSIIPAI